MKREIFYKALAIVWLMAILGLYLLQVILPKIKERGLWNF